MKSKTIYLIAATLLMGSIVASCDSCNKKQESETVATESATITETTDVATTDTTITAATEAAAPATGTATSGKSSKKNAKSAAGKSDKGYSAPDGTDAENHDGDQYTRNDKTPMPSGTPIK